MAAPAASSIAKEGLTLLDGAIEGDMAVDYVFLHGLNGHPQKTWTYKDPEGSTSFFWPAQIQADIPGCRVMTFGYNAAFERALVENTTTIDAIAQILINRLIDHRTGEHMTRPLVLIAHSLGGLVIKRALSDCHADRHAGLQTRRVKEQNAIYDSIAGIVFMGTPHAGSHVADANRVKVLKAIARATFKKVPKNLVTALSAHSRELQNLSTSFERTTLFTEHVIEICTYFEMQSTRFAGAEVVPEAMARLHYLNERLEGIPKEHTKMAKFSGPEDDGYTSIRQRLKAMGSDGLEALKARNATYRISQIPGDIVRDKLADFLSSCEMQKLGPADNFQIHSYASRLGQRNSTKTATVTFKVIPSALLGKSTEWTASFEHNNVFGRITLDTNFDGFTVLNEVEPDNHVLDFIALPGLGYHPFTIWQHNAAADPYMWLRDSLPYEVPGTQVLLYGYDADDQTRQSRLSVEGIAVSLISHLRNIGRSSLSAKPLVFLAHSLGGSILKQCLIELANSGPSDMFMLEAVKTCIFLAVPNTLPTSVKLEAMMGNKRFDKVLHDLHDDANIGYMSSLSDMLRGIAQANNIRLCSGYELAPTQYPKQSFSYDANRSEPLLQAHEFVQDGTSRADTFTVNRAHETILKLRPESQTVKTIARFLRESTEVKNNFNSTPGHTQAGGSQWTVPSIFSQWTSLVSYFRPDPPTQISVTRPPSSVLLSNEEMPSSTLYREFMATLSLHSWAREESIEKAYQDTFEWIWSNQDIGLSSWLVDGSPLFWISGKPGSGKSTLMRYLWNHQNLSDAMIKSPSDNPKLKLAFFFHHRGSHAQKSFEGMLHSILYQLLDEEPRLASLLLPDFAKLLPHERAHWTWTMPKLMKAYNDIISQTSFSVDIFLFLDALDEYDGPPEAIVHFLHTSVEKSARSSTHLKVCFSSREWPDFVESFSRGPGFKIHDYTQQDIQNYISSRVEKELLTVDRAATTTEQQAQDIREMETILASRAEGVFIWVKAVIDEISRAFFPSTPTKPLVSLVEDLPHDLDLFYAEAVKRIPQHYRMESYIMFETILRWGMSTIPIEILHAAVSCGKYNTPNDCIDAIQRTQKDSRSSQSWVQARGAGLVEITRGNHYQDDGPILMAGFMHQSVVDFILKPGFRGLILERALSLPTENGYTFVSKWVLAGAEMSYKDGGQKYAGAPSTNSLARSEATTGRSMKRFLDALHPNVLSDLLTVADYPGTITHPQTILAVVCNLRVLIQEIIQEHAGRIPNHGQFSALHYLADVTPRMPLHGFIFPLEHTPDSMDIAQLLLQHGASLDSTFDGKTPFQLLFSKFAYTRFTGSSENKYQDDPIRTRLAGHFLRFGQNPNVEISIRLPRRRHQPEKWTSCKPVHISPPQLTSLLLQYNADVNALDGEGRTPLDLACGVGGNTYEIGDHVRPEEAYEFANLLLSHGAAVTTTGNKSWAIFASIISERKPVPNSFKQPLILSRKAILVKKAKDLQRRYTRLR
ncbi:SERAC1 [Dactylonectria macrodidyma]|uniref:SERAC1 n=1 Tax=Dactylonectria macrodidyma TaxID=307937 RepID=A0A9P9FQM4_9HYPO|nr:SERAC1 [Dactylonectria macrodidyma]